MKPSLRFPGFVDAWDRVNVSSVVDSIKSGVSVNSNDSPVNKGAFGVLKTSCVYGGVFFPKENKEILANEVNRAKLNPKEDAILVSRMNTPDLVGQSGYVNHDYKNLFVPDRLWQVYIKSNHFAKFVSYIVSGAEFMSRVKSISSGTSNSMKNISQAEFLRLLMVLPSKQEQEKIAAFLTAVDERIELQSNKVEKLQTYKRGIVQKIFSQQLRFRKSDNTKFSDWESVRLRDVLNCGSKTPVINTDEYNKLTVGLNKAGVRPAKIDRKMSDTRPFYVRSKNELIVGKQNYFSGSIAVIPDELDGAIASNAIMSFTPKRGNVKFIYEYISQNNYINKRNALANGTGQKELSENDFLNFDIGIPIEEEQQKIAAFLSQIDEKSPSKPGS